MVQFFSALFFTLAAIAAGALIAAMLRSERDRIAAILSGDALQGARTAANPPVRIRVRSWSRAEGRRPSPQLRAAA